VVGKHVGVVAQGRPKILPDGALTQEFLEFIDSRNGTSLKSLAASVLLKCRQITHAQAGSIFILRGTGGRRQLEALSLQNDAIRAKSSLFVIPVSNGSIAGYVALTGDTIFVADVEHIPEEYPFSFNRGFDQKSGYTTKSIMAFPLTTAEGRVIGVVQLINSMSGPDATGVSHVVPFSRTFASFVPPVNLIVSRVIERTDAHEKIAERNRQLRVERQKVYEQGLETERAFMMSVELLARAAEVHDEGTGNHIVRVNEYSHLMATLARQPKAFCDEIRWAAALHDVGKMSVDIAVLKKPGRLDEQEWVEMRNHAAYGHAILSRHPRLAMAAEIAWAHHETWAGTGYPRKLKGEQIPLAARIVAFADIYDALRSARPYKPGFSHEKTVEIISKGDDRLKPGEHFDPKLLQIFIDNHHLFAEVFERLVGEDGR
jgi:HD-GYP domain-containing protein (c-di-GMP phosphodiesterase class II)